MSGNNAQVASFVQAVDTEQTLYYSLMAASALLFYDTLLTFPREVQLIWTRRFGVVTLLYVTARLSTLLYQISVLLPNNSLMENKDSCLALWSIADLLSSVKDISIEGIQFARVYAIMPSRRYLLSFLGLLIFSSTVARLIGDIYLARACSDQAAGSPEHLALFVSITNGSILLFDAITFGVTVHYTWSIVAFRRSLSGMAGSTSLASLMFQQGVFRFLMVFFFALVVLIEVYVPFHFGNILTCFGNTLISILVLRFVLDLRGRNAHLNGISRIDDLDTVSSFRAVTRNISFSIIDDLGDPDNEPLPVGHVMSHGSSVQAVGEAPRPIMSLIRHSDTVPTITIKEFPWIAEGFNKTEDV